MTNFYDKPRKSTNNLYKTRGNRLVTEIDFREELKEILEQDTRGSWFILRHVRLDDNGAPIKHPYTRENRSGEGPADVGQIDSNDRGYLYDDYMVLAYLNHSQAYSIYKKNQKVGESTVEYRTLYIEWDALKKATGKEDIVPSKFDRIIDVKKDLEGTVLSPLAVREKYDILSVDPYRLDSSGRIEYYRVRVISVPDESVIV